MMSSQEDNLPKGKKLAYLRNSIIFGLSLLFLLPQSFVIQCQIFIVEPPALAEIFNKTKIEGTTAAFGTPYYGERLTGELLYFNTNGCNPADYGIVSREAFNNSKDDRSSGSSRSSISSNKLPKIVMVQRGDCHFVTKVQIAESKGAKAVIIADNPGSMSTSADVKKVIMADDGWGDSIRIPSVLIGEVDAIHIIRFALQNQEIVVELAWDIPKEHAVSMEYWISLAVSQSLTFLKSYAPYALELKTKLDFRPHYWILSLPGNFKDMCTDDTGRYCSLDPDWGGKTTGKIAVEESVRQLCLWQTTQYLNTSDPHSGFYSEAWWKYIERFTEECPHNGSDANRTLGEACSYNLMSSLSVNILQVKKCYEQNFETLVEHELSNKAWSPMALMINNWRYSGLLDAEIVTRAVCTAFKTEQEECRKLFHPSIAEIMDKGVYVEEVIHNGFPLWAVVFLSVSGGVLGLLFSSIIFWKLLLPRLKSSMRYAIMSEVRREVSNYDCGVFPVAGRLRSGSGGVVGNRSSSNQTATTADQLNNYSSRESDKDNGDTCESSNNNVAVRYQPQQGYHTTYTSINPVTHAPQNFVIASSPLI